MSENTSTSEQFKGEDLTGKKFGRLRVLHFSHFILRPNSGRTPFWKCRCKCSNITYVSSSNLRSGECTSCGCYAIECTIVRSLRHGYAGKYERNPTYTVWRGMKQRCLDENCAIFSRYGGRGITICRRWMKFENFLKDMGEKPDGLTLERINNKKGYCKSNCEWATRKVQARNRSTTRWITFRGITQCLAAWSEDVGISHSTISNRILLKWTIEKALTEPLRGRK